MSHGELNTRVARRIAELRDAKSLTQREVAERLDIAVRNYQRIEYGEHSLTLRMVETIAYALDVAVEDLLVPPVARTAHRNRGRPRGKRK